MNPRTALLFLIVLITLMGGFIVYDVRSKKKINQNNVNPYNSNTENWKWNDDWNNHKSIPHEQPKNNPVSPEPPLVQQIIAQDYNDAIRKSSELGKPVLVFFTANWCDHCKKMKQEVLPDLQVKELLKNYIFVTIDTDQNQSIAVKFNLQFLPSYVITNGKEENLKMGNGYSNAASFAQWLNNPNLFNQPKNSLPPSSPSSPIGSQPNGRNDNRRPIESRPQPNQPPQMIQPPSGS